MQSELINSLCYQRYMLALIFSVYSIMYSMGNNWWNIHDHLSLHNNITYTYMVERGCGIGGYAPPFTSHKLSKSNHEVGFKLKNIYFNH